MGFKAFLQSAIAANQFYRPCIWDDMLQVSCPDVGVPAACCITASLARCGEAAHTAASNEAHRQCTPPP